MISGYGTYGGGRSGGAYQAANGPANASPGPNGDLYAAADVAAAGYTAAVAAAAAAAAAAAGSARVSRHSLNRCYSL